jgi:cell division protein FtsB
MLEFIKSQFGLPAILILIGLILSAIGGFMTAHKAWRNEKIVNNKNEEIKALAKENVNLIQENKKLTNEALAQITGGDSWAYLDVGARSAQGILPNCGIIVQLVGDHPLTSVSILFSERIKKGQGAALDTPLINVTLPVIQHNLMNFNDRYIGHFQLEMEKREDVWYHATINSRNGSVEQLINIKKIQNKGWLMATRVKRFIHIGNGAYKPEILLEKYDEGFPKEGFHWE